jgi:hypothetical protein
LFEQFRPQRTLACDDVLVIEGMNEGSSLLATAFARRRIGFIKTGAVQDDFGAVLSRS